MSGDPFETIHNLTKALLAIAMYKPNDTSIGGMAKDLAAIRNEAVEALKLAGYDFETLMHDQVHDHKGNAEA